MSKPLITILLIVGSLLQSACGSTNNSKEENPMNLSQPSFANAQAYYNTYVSGVQDGGTGIEFYLEIGVLPADVVLENVYFRESVGKLMRGNENYVARFRTDTGNQPDVIMSSDENEEAANRPPMETKKFPFPLSDQEAGISYREKGVLKYARISKVEKRDSIAYPGAPPRDGGQ